MSVSVKNIYFFDQWSMLYVLLNAKPEIQIWNKLLPGYPIRLSISRMHFKDLLIKHLTNFDKCQVTLRKMLAISTPLLLIPCLVSSGA